MKQFIQHGQVTAALYSLNKQYVITCKGLSVGKVTVSDVEFTVSTGKLVGLIDHNDCTDLNSIVTDCINELKQNQTT